MSNLKLRTQIQSTGVNRFCVSVSGSRTELVPFVEGFLSFSRERFGLTVESFDFDLNGADDRRRVSARIFIYPWASHPSNSQIQEVIDRLTYGAENGI